MPDALLERDAEIDVLVRRLSDAREGRGGLVLVEGTAGSGKSALLRALRSAAAETDVHVRSATGGELEQDFAFGLVRQLFEPVVLGADPAERERLLDGAAALAAPVVGAGPMGQETGFDSSFAVLHGLYWLTAALAEQRPLLLLVDDGHWGDVPSLQYLDFLARRVPELPVLVVVAMRPNEPGAPSEQLGRLAAAPEVELVHPRPLSDDAARILLDEALAAPASDAVVTAARAATGGNPLLVRELARTLASTDAPPTPADVEDAVPSTVTRSVARRLSRLPGPASEIAEALAVAGPDVLAVVTGRTPGEVADALDALRAADLVEDAPPRFVHPLIRQAVANALPATRLASLHLDAARALREREGAEEDTVAHLLNAPPLDEPWVIPLLQASAGRALAEGAPGIAARRLRRVLELTPPGDVAADGLSFALGVAEIRAGDEGGWTRVLAARRSEEPTIAGSAVLLQLSLFYLAEGETARDLVDEATALLGALPGGPLADGLRLQLINGGILDPGLSEERRAIVAAITPDDPWTHVAMLAWERACSDAPADEIGELVRRVLGGRPLADLSAAEQPWWMWAVTIGHYAGLKAETDVALKDGELTARRNGSRLARAWVCFARADWSLYYGSAADIVSFAREATDLFADFGTDLMRTATLAMLVSGLAATGEFDAAEELAAELGTDAELEGSFPGLVSYLSRGRLELARGRPADAVGHFRRVVALSHRYGWTRYAPGDAEALLALALGQDGQHDEARTIATAELESARARGLVSTEAAALRALAFARPTDDAERIALLREAAACAQRAERVLLGAEIQLELGASLRRANQRVEARTELAKARELAEKAGAARVSAQATEELTIAGGRPRRVATSGVGSLTPAERRVAEHAAAGLSNREIAETLFVTKKTVELHLGNAYGKLGIRSRTQLAGAMAD